MNIQDVEAPPLPGSWQSILDAIFQRQRELIEEYKEIEKLPFPPVSLHHAAGQKILKDFAWRSTEELTEAMEAYRKHGGDDTRALHGNEEMADALHFLVELLIYAGIGSVQCGQAVPEFPTGYEAAHCVKSTWLDAQMWEAVYRLGIAMNFLRNKPWKQAQVFTDEARCRAALLDAFKAHVMAWAAIGLTQTDMFGYYFRKSDVNKFRQRSKY